MKQTFVKAAVLACCMAAVGCKQAPMTMGPGEYAVMTIATTDREIPSNYSATIRGRQDIAIYPQVSGTISQLCVNEGQKVAKGQTLFIIDQVPYKAALQTAEANVEAAKAGVATAQLTYDSKKELFARNVVSQFDLSTANNNLLTAKAQLAQAEAQRVNAANNLSYTVVKAPTDGVVGTLPYRVGALVSASIPQPLTTVSDNSEMYVYFSMTENQLLALTRQYGSIAETLKSMPGVQLQLSDGSTYDQTGRVESISGVIDTSTGSVSLRAAFPNPNGLLLANACFDTVHKIGMPEARIPLAEATIYLATSPKSNSAYMAIDRAMGLAAKDTNNRPVPLHIRNAPTKLMKELDYGKNYKYAHDFEGNFAEQEFMPEGLVGHRFYQPADNPKERELAQRITTLWKGKY